MAVNDFEINGAPINGDVSELAPVDFGIAIADRIKLRLTEQFRNKEQIYNLVDYFVEGSGNISFELEQLFNDRNLAIATGFNLDILGAHVNVPRGGLDDEAYRREIYLRVFQGTSEGTPEDILQYLRLTTSPLKAKYWNMFPAAYQLFTDGGFVDRNIASNVQGITPAGVNSFTTVIASHGEEPFVTAEVEVEEVILGLNEDDDFKLHNNGDLGLNSSTSTVQDVEYGGGFGETADGTLWLENKDDFILENGDLLSISFGATGDTGFPIAEVYQNV
jgi:hypothetical protein